ncbi:MAG: hypothetical protein ABJQ39_03945 [Winogradskyella arenosi]
MEERVEECGERTVIVLLSTLSFLDIEFFQNEIKDKPPPKLKI